MNNIIAIISKTAKNRIMDDFFIKTTSYNTIKSHYFKCFVKFSGLIGWISFLPTLSTVHFSSYNDINRFSQT